MGIGKRDDLAGVGGIGEDFLVTAHGGIENDFSYRAADGADSLTLENRSIFKRKNGRTGQANLQTQRNNTGRARSQKGEMGNLISPCYINSALVIHGDTRCPVRWPGM